MRIRRRIRFLLLQILLLVILLEGGLRIYAHATDQPRGLGFHPDFGWKPLPDVEKVGPEWCDEVPARMNSRGWRDIEHPLRKPEDRTRIVALGDSITFGQSVDYGQRFTEVIEDTLKGVDVVNLAVTGHGTDQELRIFEEEGWRYQPDIVLLNVYVANDLSDIRHRIRFSWPKPYFRLTEGALELVPPRASIEIRVRTASYLAEGVLRVFGGDTRCELAPEWESTDPVPLFLALVRRLKEGVEKHRARLLVVVHYPSRARTGIANRSDKRILGAVGDAQVPLLDLMTHLAAAAKLGRTIWLPDNHLTPDGHAVVAEAIVGKLRSLGWIP